MVIEVVSYATAHDNDQLWCYSRFRHQSLMSVVSILSTFAISTKSNDRMRDSLVPMACSLLTLDGVSPNLAIPAHT